MNIIIFSTGYWSGPLEPMKPDSPTMLPANHYSFESAQEWWIVLKAIIFIIKNKLGRADYHCRWKDPLPIFMLKLTKDIVVVVVVDIKLDIDIGWLWSEPENGKVMIVCMIGGVLGINWMGNRSRKWSDGNAVRLNNATM